MLRQVCKLTHPVKAGTWKFLWEEQDTLSLPHPWASLEDGLECICGMGLPQFHVKDAQLSSGLWNHPHYPNPYLTSQLECLVVFHMLHSQKRTLSFYPAPAPPQGLNFPQHGKWHSHSLSGTDPQSTRFTRWFFSMVPPDPSIYPIDSNLQTFLKSVCIPTSSHPAATILHPHLGNGLPTELPFFFPPLTPMPPPLLEHGGPARVIFNKR